MSRMRQKRKARATAERAEAARADRDADGELDTSSPVDDDALEDELADASEDEPPDVFAGEPADAFEAKSADDEPYGDPDERPARLDAAADEDEPGDGAADDRSRAGDDDDDAVQELAGERLDQVIESILFASDKPLNVARIKQLTRVKDTAQVEESLARLSAFYEQRGIVLHDIAGGYQFRTHPGNSGWVQQLVAGKPVRLTRAQLETLAIVAYRQPITRPEIDEIRGVDSGGTLHLLLDRNLIRVLGKKEEPGRPLLYGTSKEFLEFFNLGDLRDLPTLREYHELTEDSMREVEKKLGPDAARGAQAFAAGSNGHAAETPGEPFDVAEAADALAEAQPPGAEAELDQDEAAGDADLEPRADAGGETSDFDEGDETGLYADAGEGESAGEGEAAAAADSAAPSDDSTDDTEPTASA